MTRATLWLSRSAGGPVALFLLTMARGRIGDDRALLLFSATMPFALAINSAVFSTRAAAGERVMWLALARRSLLVTAPALLLLGIGFTSSLWLVGSLWCGATVGAAVTLEQARRYMQEPSLRNEALGALLAPVGWLVAATLVLAGAPLTRTRLAPHGVSGAWIALAIAAVALLVVAMRRVEERSAVVESVAMYVDRLVLPLVVPAELSVPIAWASRAAGVWGALSAKRVRDRLLLLRHHPETVHHATEARATPRALLVCAIALVAWPFDGAIAVSYAVCAALLLSAHNAVLLALDAPYFSGHQPLATVLRVKQRYHVVSGVVFLVAALLSGWITAPTTAQRVRQLTAHWPADLGTSPAMILVSPLLGAVALVVGVTVATRHNTVAAHYAPTDGAAA